MGKNLSLHDFLMSSVSEDDIKSIIKQKPDFFTSGLIKKINISDVKVINVLEQHFYSTYKKQGMGQIVDKWLDSLSEEGKADFGAYVIDGLKKTYVQMWVNLCKKVLNESDRDKYSLYNDYKFFFHQPEETFKYLNELYEKKGEAFFKKIKPFDFSLVNLVDIQNFGKLVKYYKGLDSKLFNNEKKWQREIYEALLKYLLQGDINNKSPKLLNETLKGGCEYIYTLYKEVDIKEYPNKEKILLGLFNALKSEDAKTINRKCTLDLLNYIHKMEMKEKNESVFTKNKETLYVKEISNLIEKPVEFENFENGKGFYFKAKFTPMSLVISMRGYAPQIAKDLYPETEKYKFIKSSENLIMVLVGKIERILNKAYGPDIIKVKSTSIDSERNALLEVEIPTGNSHMIIDLKEAIKDIFLVNPVSKSDGLVERLGLAMEQSIMKYEKDLNNEQRKRPMKNIVRKF